MRRKADEIRHAAEKSGKLYHAIIETYEVFGSVLVLFHLSKRRGLSDHT